jgi:hypothetical protein
MNINVLNVKRYKLMESNNSKVNKNKKKIEKKNLNLKINLHQYLNTQMYM